ncbi:2Fe-2S iron-sulfur cluster-binding protein, partial [Acinetobacter baumannii]
FTLYKGEAHVDRTAVTDQLAGNLCRCTGYRPIVDAALAACGSRSDTSLLSSSSETAARLAALNDGADIFIGDATTFFAAPASIASL